VFLVNHQGSENCPAEALRTRRKEFLYTYYSELCELCASVVKMSSDETRKKRFKSQKRKLEREE
jgi:hypothetical protein